MARTEKNFRATPDTPCLDSIPKEGSSASLVEGFDREIAATYVRFVDAGQYDLTDDLSFFKLLDIGERCARTALAHAVHTYKQAPVAPIRSAHDANDAVGFLSNLTTASHGCGYDRWFRETFASLPARAALLQHLRDFAARRADPGLLLAEQQQEIRRQEWWKSWRAEHAPEIRAARRAQRQGKRLPRPEP